MSAEQHARAKQIFLTACRLSPAQRAVYLRATCGDDEELRAGVEQLLEFHSEATTSAQASSEGELVVPPHVRVVERALPPGTGVSDRYRIVSLLGQPRIRTLWLADCAGGTPSTGGCRPSTNVNRYLSSGTKPRESS